VMKFYFCPSRRDGARYVNGAHGVLMDYCAVTPSKITVDATGKVTHEFDTTAFYWQGGSHCMPHDTVWRGLIIRVNLDAEPNGNCSHNYSNLDNAIKIGSSPEIVTAGDCPDGLSNTLMLAEKRLNPHEYVTGAWHDDRGWTDGWDPDIIRSTAMRVGQDTDTVGDTGYMIGSAHANVFVGCFGDGSVRPISYQIDRNILDFLADRRDRQVIPGDSF
jgi:hypothetical protein